MNTLMERWIKHYGLQKQDEILQFSMRLLDKSEERFQALTDFHQKQFLNLSMYQKPPIEAYKIIFSAQLLPAAEPTLLVKGSEVLCESEQGEICTYTMDEDMWISHTQINLCYFTDEIGRIYPCLHDDRIHFKDDMSNIEKNEIHFHFNALFDFFKKIAFTLYFKTSEEEFNDLLNDDFYTWIFKIEDQEYVPLLMKTKNGIHFSLLLEKANSNQNYVLCLRRKKHFLSLKMKDIYIQLEKKEEEIKTYYDEERKKSLQEPIFDTNLSLFSNCYLSSELLSHQQGTHTLHLYIDYQIILQEPLIPVEEYKLIMKHLPKKQTYYDVFCEQVQLSYYNGEDWQKITEFDCFLHCFKEQKRYLSFTFTLPNIKKYEGIESGYLLRFTNVYAQDNFLYPLKFHVPCFTKIILSYSHEEKISPDKVIQYQNLDVNDISEDCKYGLLSLFNANLNFKPTLWVAFYEKLPPLYECFLTMEEEQSVHHYFTLMTPYGSMVRFNDGTSGLAHHGKFTILEGDRLHKSIQFGEEAYWIAFVFEEQTKQIGIQDIKYNCVSAKNIHYSEQYFYLREENIYLLSNTIDILSLKVEVQEYDSISQMKSWMPYTLKNEEEGLGRYVIYDEFSHAIKLPLHIVQRNCLVSDEEVLHVIYKETILHPHTIVKGSSHSLMEEPRNIPAVISVCENYGYEPPLSEQEQLMQASWKMGIDKNIVHTEDMIRSIKMEFIGVKEVKFSYEKNLYDETFKKTLFVIVRMNNKDEKICFFQEKYSLIQQKVRSFFPDDDTLPIVISKPLLLYVSIQMKIKYEDENIHLEKIEKMLAHLVYQGNENNGFRQIGEYLSESHLLKMLVNEGIQYHELHVQVYYFKNNVKITRCLQDLPYFSNGLMVNGQHIITWLEEYYV